MSKFKLPGHSFPGIKGFKSTSKADGRAASSAFQQETTEKRIVPTLTTTKQEDDAAAAAALELKNNKLNTDNAEGAETEETKTKGTELTTSDDLDWIKNYDDDDETTVVDPNLASAQKEGQGGWNYAAQEIIKAKKRLDTPEAKEEKLKKKEARKAAKEEKKRKKELAKSQKEEEDKTLSEKLDDQINEK
jgi:hypothetical protein